MLKRKTMVLLGVKLLVVGGLVAWFYSRSEARLGGEEGEVESAAGAMAVGGPGGRPVPLEMDREHATELYNLVREGTWASPGGEPPRATVDIRYSTGVADHLEFRGRDVVRVNGTSWRVNGAMLRALLEGAERDSTVVATTEPARAGS